MLMGQMRQNFDSAAARCISASGLSSVAQSAGVSESAKNAENAMAIAIVNANWR